MFMVIAEPLVASEEAACNLIRYQQSLPLLSAGLFTNMNNYTCRNTFISDIFAFRFFCVFNFANKGFFCKLVKQKHIHLGSFANKSSRKINLLGTEKLQINVFLFLFILDLQLCRPGLAAKCWEKNVGVRSQHLIYIFPLNVKLKWIKALV